MPCDDDPPRRVADWDKVPRDFLTMVRLLAVAGGIRAAAMAYYGFAGPEALTAAEAAARSERVRDLADRGEEGLVAGYVAKVGLVGRAAERCADDAPEARAHSGDCRLARLWLQRYRQRTEEVLREPARFPQAVRAAAASYAAAERQLGDVSSSAPSGPAAAEGHAQTSEEGFNPLLATSR
jgi:hypothetical protein